MRFFMTALRARLERSSSSIIFAPHAINRVTETCPRCLRFGPENESETNFKTRTSERGMDCPPIERSLRLCVHTLLFEECRQTATLKSTLGLALAGEHLFDRAADRFRSR
jgi:hypothetical protein